jgi:hypothetical protein
MAQATLIFDILSLMILSLGVPVNRTRLEKAPTLGRFMLEGDGDLSILKPPGSIVVFGCWSGAVSLGRNHTVDLTRMSKTPAKDESKGFWKRPSVAAPGRCVDD